MRGSLLLGLVLAVAGCNPYVNIPPDDGDVASHKVNRSRVREAMLVSIRAVVREHPPDGPYAIALPKGADDRTYAFVAGHLPGDARRADGNEDLPTYRVVAVRLRGLKGRVSIRRSNTPAPSLTTVSVRNDIESWYAADQRTWRKPLPGEGEPAAGSEGQDTPAASDTEGGDGKKEAGSPAGKSPSENGS